MCDPLFAFTVLPGLKEQRLNARWHIYDKSHMAVEALSVCASKICMQAVKEAHKQKKLDTNKNVLRMKRVTD